MTPTNNDDDNNDGKNIRLHEEKLDERGGGEALWTAPTKKRKSQSK
jgi:hypothetical protein